MSSIRWITGSPRNLEVALRHSSSEQIVDQLPLVLETLAGFIHKEAQAREELSERVSGMLSRLDRLEQRVRVLDENAH